MAERPSFRRLRDVRRLLVALAGPWVLGALALLVGIGVRGLVRSGWWADWLDPVVLVAFYGLMFAGLFWLPGTWLLGVWWLVWRPSYRRSWYGWLWPALMYLDLCGAVPFLGWVMDR